MSKAQKGKQETDVAKKISGNQRIKDLEAELSKTKVNKRTESAVGLLKAKIAQLKEKEEMRAVKGRGPKDGYSVRKTGDGTAVLVGFPSVGKSTLLNTLTNAESAVAAYAFTTLTVIPGLLEHRHSRVQILDVPGIVQGAAAGTGRGKEVLQVMRNADLVIFVIDVFHPEHYDLLKKEVYDSGIRVNQEKPDIKIVKTGKGGIDIGATVQLTHLDKETITNVLKEFGIINAQIVLRQDATVDQLIDVIQSNKVYIPAITLLNKMDLVDEKTLFSLKEKIKPDLFISGGLKKNIPELKDLIIDHMKLIKVFLKEVGKKPDMNEPMILRKNDTIEQVCAKLHRTFVNNFKYARIWGPSAKFDGQVKRDLHHVVQDGDIIEIHIK